MHSFQLKDVFMKEVEYSSKDLDHLGIVSAMCDEIDLVNTIDRLIPPDPKAVLATGESIKLMVINGLGFTSRPLYLEAQFYEGKPIERLLGRQCESVEISDDRLGKALDRCYDLGCDTLFASIALKAAIKYNVDRTFRHLDTTSMEVDGEYILDDQKIPLVTFGHSKDHRPDLKQFMMSLICSRDGDVPLLAQTIAGNTSDKTHFRETLLKLKSQIDQEKGNHYFIADSALYTSETVKETSSFVKWITRVPDRITEASQLIHKYTKKDLKEIADGYFGIEVGSMYGGIPQRWLLIYSEQAFTREKKTLEKRIKKELEVQKKEIKVLASKEFDCECDARKALSDLAKKLKYHQIGKIQILQKNEKSGRGRPKKDEPTTIKYKITSELVTDESKIGHALERKGKFIIATNELDEKALSVEDLLKNYKGQQSVERGFRFLKDPLFMTSSVFLKKDTRIVALGMVMCLCLLVYTLAQRYLRQKLEELSTSVPNQLGKPTKKPTMRWIFQIFEGVHVLIHRTLEGTKEIILNINPTRRHILQILGPPFEKIYASAA
jgi:transposase